MIVYGTLFSVKPFLCGAVMKDIQAIFFDFGGTLAFEPYSHEDSFYTYLRRRGISASYDDVVAGVRAMERYHDAWRKAHPDDGSKKIGDRFWYHACLEFARSIPSITDHEDLAELLHADHRVIPNHLYADTLPTLEHFRRCGVPMGIISNWDAPTLEWVLRDLAIRDYFSAAVSSRCAECEKPAPGIFHEACGRLKVSPEHAVMVGDNPDADIRGALSVGMKGIWINRTGNGKHPKCLTIHRLTELTTALAM